MNKCPICQTLLPPPFFESPPVPVFCNVLWPTAAEASEAPAATIRLTFCPTCGFIYNSAFDPALVHYAPSYENSLHCSDRFDQYARELVARLVRTYQLRDKMVVEIGCGRGEFLTMLCEAAGCRGAGFDPGFALGPDVRVSPRVRILPELFNSQTRPPRADLVCCRHVLEHMHDPLLFMVQLRWALDSHEPALYFEVPCATATFEGMGIWDIIYEHPGYFMPHSLEQLFLRSGFQPMRLDESYEGQFLSIEARPSGERPSALLPPQDLRPLQALTGAFGESYRRKVDLWQTRLEGLRRRRKRTVLWGGGSKGVTFLNAMKADRETVACVVDINPRKQGKFIPGTAQRVVGPEHLAQDPPDVVIVMNSIYLEEIRQSMRQLGVQVEMAAA